MMTKFLTISLPSFGRFFLICAVAAQGPINAGVGSTGGGSAERFTVASKERSDIAKSEPLLNKVIIARRKKSVQNYIQRTLKEDLKAEISTWNEQKVKLLARYLSPEISEKFRDLFLKNLQEVASDIDASPYFDSEKVTQIWGRAKDAVTVHDRNSPILYDLTNLAIIGSLPKEPILALFFHEHMRHFEFNDDDYQLGHLMTFARNPILLGALNADINDFWKELAKSILAKAWQNYSSQPLLCPSSGGANLGMISCNGLAEKPLNQIFDRFPSDNDSSTKRLALNKASELILETCRALGINPDLDPLLNYLNAQPNSTVILPSDVDFESFAKLIQPEKATSISWRVLSKDWPL